MGYTANKEGIITNPGKFEGELTVAAYFWEQANEGGATDEVFYSGDDTQFSFFVFDKVDKVLYPAIKDDYGMSLYESDNGFVHAVYYKTQEDYQGSIDELERG